MKFTGTKIILNTSEFYLWNFYQGNGLLVFAVDCSALWSLSRVNSIIWDKHILLQFVKLCKLFNEVNVNTNNAEVSWPRSSRLLTVFLVNKMSKYRCKLPKSRVLGMPKAEKDQEWIFHRTITDWCSRVLRWKNFSDFRNKLLMITVFMLLTLM